MKIIQDVTLTKSSLRSRHSSHGRCSGHESEVPGSPSEVTPDVPLHSHGEATASQPVASFPSDICSDPRN